MNKETLRMQMLAGIITEARYAERIGNVANYLNSNKDEFLEKMELKSKHFGIDYSTFFPFEQTSKEVATSTGGEGTIHASFSIDDLANEYPEDEFMEVQVGEMQIIFGSPEGNRGDKGLF
jgi:hypothetical protein